MKSTYRSIWLLGVSAVSLVPMSAAWAQSVGNGNDDIIVTAQRRSERLQDVPMSITAVSTKAVEERGIRNLQDLGQTVAGVQIGFQGSFTYPAVRGVSSLSTGVGFENNVGVYVDGFYQPDVTAINADFANLESLQVLKGPQSALYGRNATGGAILIQTKRPSDTFTGKSDLRYGSYDDKIGSAYISGPLTEGLRFSVAAYARETDGYYDALNAVGVKIGNAAPILNVSVRAKLEANIGDSLTATAALNYIYYKDGRGSMFSYEQFRGASLPAKVGRLYDQRTFATNRYTLSRTKTYEPTLKLVWETGLGDLTSYTGYADRKIAGDFDFDGSWLDSSFSFVRYYEKTFQQGLDFNIKGVEGLDLVVGGTYYWDRTKANPSDSLANNTLLLRTITSTRTEALAAFVDGTFHLSDRLSIGFGGRYTSERRKIEEYRATTISTGLSRTIPTGTDPNFNSNNFSPRGVLTYKVADNTNIYASISRGFRSGFVQPVSDPLNTSAAIVNRIKPETITSYEVGFKTAASNFRFDAAAFYYDYKNIQVGLTLPNPALPSSPINITQNAEKAEIYGAEAGGSLSLGKLELDASVSWLHARYVKFSNVAGTGFNAATNLNIGGQVQDWSGQQMVRAPSFSATFGATYKTGDVLGGTLDMNANVKYTSSYVPRDASLYGPAINPLTGAVQPYIGPAGLAGTQRFRQAGYALVNASINWTDPSDTYTVGLWVNNLTDHDYRLSYSGNANGSYGTWAWPRQWGGRFSVKY